MRISLCVLWIVPAIYADETIDNRFQRAGESFRSGDYAAALVELTELERMLTPGPPTSELVGVKNLLAMIHSDRANYREAERGLLLARALCSQLPEAAGACSMPILNSLLSVYLKAGWHGKAERFRDEVQLELDRAGKPKDPQFLSAKADLLRARKRFAEAEAHYGRALALVTASGSPESTGFLWNSIGLVRVDQKKQRAAAGAFREAIAAHERNFGTAHPALVSALTNLAGIVLAEGQPDVARALLDRAVGIAIQSLGPSHPSLYHILILQAKALDRMRLKLEARRSRARAEEVRHSFRAGDVTIDFEDLRRK